jgi:hypothetical protein
MGTSAQVNLRFDQAAVQLLDELAEGLALSRSETVRFALHQLHQSSPIKRRNRFAESLRKRFGNDAALQVELDEKFDPVAIINGERCSDVYLFAQATRLGDEDCVQIWVGDVATDDVRIFLGVLPLRMGVPLVVPLASLSAGMRPRAVAWFIGAE